MDGAHRGNGENGGDGGRRGGGVPWRREVDLSLELRVGSPAREDQVPAAPSVESTGRANRAPGLEPPPGPERDPKRERLWTRLGAALAGLVLLLLLDGAVRVGPTYDEHFYAAAGRAYLESADFGLNREHPPLLKYLAGLPLWILGVDLPPNWRDQVAYPASFFYGVRGAELDWRLVWVRFPFCLLSAWLVWAVFRTGRAWFGARAGFVGAALIGLNPNWLAHGRLAGLDAGTATLIFVAWIGFVHALERPTARRTLGAAIGFGLANLAKFTGLLLGPACIALAVLAALWTKRPQPLLTLARVLLGGLSVFALGYAFEARPINRLWGEPPYPLAVPRDTPPPGSLDRAFRAALAARGLPEGQGLGLGPNAPANAELEAALAGLAQGSGPRQAAFAEALLALADGPGDLRKRAVDGLLSEPVDPLDGALRWSLVSRLAERTLLGPEGESEGARLERWRRWFDRARAEDWNERIFKPGPFDVLARGLLGDTWPVPLVSALKGIDYQLYHGRYGHGTYFRGVSLQAGRDFEGGNPFPEYYAVVMGVKHPLALLLAVGLGIVLALLTPRRFGLLRLVAALGFPAGCFWLFSTGNALMGVRYVLPILPFLALFGARLAASWPRAALVLAIAAAGESLWIHPHQLMYYNTLVGGPKGGPKWTVVGDDWGQDVRATGRFYARHREAIEAAGGLHYEPYSVADPAAFGLESTRVPSGPVRGIVAVHQIHYWREREKWAWLDGFEPFHRLGYSVLLFDTRAGPPGADPLWR